MPPLGQADGRIADLEKQAEKSRRIIAALMDRVERSMDFQGGAFSLFQAAIALDQRIKERTAALTEVNHQLQKEVAERRRAETTARDAKTQAEQANLSKTKFLAAASHDLLQPLNAARLFLASLGDLEQTAQSAKLIEKTDEALSAVEDLLEALLDISKLDAGVVEKQPSDFPIAMLLRGLESEAAAMAAERGLALRVVPSSVTVHSDQRLLRRILQNFVSNALKYTRKGRVLVGCRRVGAGLRIEVRDTGPGIPEAKLAEIFEEFRQLDDDRNRRERGMGLGLAIVDRIARMLEHTVTVTSQPGKGSCFAVTVPLGNPTPLTVSTVRSRSTPASFAGRRVLVIDNDPEILDGMAALLGGWGCLVTVAGSGPAALARLTAVDIPEAILVDHHLDRGETGFSVIEVVRGVLGEAIPVALITADRSTELAVRARALGIPVLNKPIKPAQLRALLGKLISGSAAGEPAGTA